MRIHQYCLLVFLFFSMTSWSQRGSEVGLLGGISYYFGDLNDHFDFAHPGPSASLIGRRVINPRLSLQVGLDFGYINGDDSRSSNAFEVRRNLSFQSHVLDLHSGLEFNFFPYIHGSRDENYTPFVVAGMSLFWFEPTAEYQGDRVKLRPLGTEGQNVAGEYSAVQPSIYYGGGFKFDINRDWSINLIITGRRTFTDYLDDVSTVYPDYNDLLALRSQVAVDLADRSIPDENGNKLGETGRQRGDDSKDDHIAFIHIGLIRYFGNIQCPEISKIRQ
jgi:hypothetical protein